MDFEMYRACPEGHYAYVIQPGDTLYHISFRLEVPLGRILEANPGVDPYRLMVGQTICIPACPPNHFPVIIEPGDTLYALARKYHVTVESILAANPGIDPYSLWVAQRICIPSVGVFVGRQMQ